MNFSPLTGLLLLALSLKLGAGKAWVDEIKKSPLTTTYQPQQFAGVFVFKNAI